MRMSKATGNKEMKKLMTRSTWSLIVLIDGFRKFAYIRGKVKINKT